MQKNFIRRMSAHITRNVEVAEEWYEMELTVPALTSESTPLPGQFITLGFSHLFFRRPFAISASHSEKDTQRISILYKKQISYTPASTIEESTQTENATQTMSKMHNGDTLDVMGYHGNSFPPPSSKDELPILVGGGIGLGPLLYLASERPDHILIVGARTSSHIPYSLLQEKNVSIATDDGSAGSEGTAILVLKKTLDELKNNSPKTTPTVYFCGPLPMMHAGAQLCVAQAVSSFASFDAMMACAMGSCVGCVCPVRSSTANDENFAWKKVCVEGAVFDCKDILWEKFDDTH